MKYALGLLWLLAACTPTPAPDSPRGHGGADLCAAAEARLESLDCRDPRGEPMWVNRGGERFAETCRKASNQGGVFLDPGCIANAASCAEANQCPAQ
ncbi:MAG: hypothetical protein Tsb0020_39110 [Haliangiales bacterium]